MVNQPHFWGVPRAQTGLGGCPLHTQEADRCGRDPVTVS